jgi:integrase/recombinase XerD
MLTKDTTIQFQSYLSPLMKKFVQEKQACGYQYIVGAEELKRFDQFLVKAKLNLNELPKSIVQEWLMKQAHESAANHQRRISTIRQFAMFLVRLGYPAYVPPERLRFKNVSSFSPRILTHAEIQKLFQAVDQLTPSSHTPMRHIVMPEIFRLLYGCGFRVSEVLNLRIRDVDLNQGILIVRNGKFGKDRLVPPSLMLIKRLQTYAAHLENQSPDAFFFPSPSHGPWTIHAIYFLFRNLLYRCGISHGGRGKGPRLHDIRHTFVVHKLIQWYKEDTDLNAKLLLLVTYLGHQNFTGTQKYLHLTAELFPELILRMNSHFGDVIPRRTP